jgi:hypothetical protein
MLMSTHYHDISFKLGTKVEAKQGGSKENPCLAWLEKVQNSFLHENMCASGA